MTTFIVSMLMSFIYSIWVVIAQVLVEESNRISQGRRQSLSQQSSSIAALLVLPCALTALLGWMAASTRQDLSASPSVALFVVSLGPSAVGLGISHLLSGRLDDLFLRIPFFVLANALVFQVSSIFL